MSELRTVLASMAARAEQLLGRARTTSRIAQWDRGSLTVRAATETFVLDVRIAGQSESGCLWLSVGVGSAQPARIEVLQLVEEFDGLVLEGWR